VTLVPGARLVNGKHVEGGNDQQALTPLIETVA
jgi:hypothetical protein